jgi:hypothetical protein
MLNARTASINRADRLAVLPLSHVAVQHPSRMGRLVLNLIVTSSQVAVSSPTRPAHQPSDPSSPVTPSGNCSFLLDMGGAFWSMQWIPVPSEFKIGEMVCWDGTKTSSLTVSSAWLSDFKSLEMYLYDFHLAIHNNQHWPIWIWSALSNGGFE